VLQTTAIFANVGKGVMAAKEDLQVRWQQLIPSSTVSDMTGGSNCTSMLLCTTTWQVSSALYRFCNSMCSCHNQLNV
jgi:hypothetical protein